MAIKDFKTILRKQQLKCNNEFNLSIDNFDKKDIEDIYDRYEQGDKFDKELNIMMEEGIKDGYVPTDKNDKNLIILLISMFEDESIYVLLWEIMTRIGSENDKVGIFCKNNDLKRIKNLFYGCDYIDEFFNSYRLALYDGMPEEEMNKLVKHLMNDYDWNWGNIEELREIINVR